MRASGHILLAWSLPELVELIECAFDCGHQIDFVHAYYSDQLPLARSELSSLLVVLSRGWRSGP